MRLHALVLAVIVVAVGALPALAGRIVGTVKYGGTLSPASSVAVRAYAAGRGMAHSASSDRDGRFLIADLPAGRYAVCIGASQSSRPQVSSVAVPEEGDAEVHFRPAPSIEVEGDSWLQGYPVFHQTFTASGLSVTGLKLKGFGPGRRVKVQMREGAGTSGQPIGPARKTIEFGGEGETAICWSGGELPTVPGRQYTFEMSAPDGEVWIPGVAGRGDVYPLGSAYFGGDPRPLTDLGFALCEENDGLSTSYALSAGTRAIFVRAVGQKFAARSTGILFASAAIVHATSRASYVRFSIHEDGPGGRQIGPSKGVSVGMDAAVAWLPGEVNVTPGKHYYLHVETFDGDRFYAYEELDSYVKGAAFNDAVLDHRYDLAAFVVGQLSREEQERLLRHPNHVTAVPLTNPSFEEGMTGWTLTKDLGKAVGCDGGVIPAWDEKMFGWTNKGEGEGWRTVIYQKVNVKKGKRYAFSGSVYTDRIGGRSSDQKVRLVVNARGRPEFTNDAMTSSQWYATEGQWRRGSVEFTSQADSIVVGFELEQRWSLESCSLYADGALLEEIEGK